MKIGLALVILFASCSWVFCQDDDTVGPDRPSFSSSSHIVPAGHVQLEGGTSRFRYGKSSGYDAGELLVRVGLSQRIEARVGAPSYLVSRDASGRKSGADDLLIESKIRLRSGDRAAFGVLASAILPTGSRSVAEHTFQPGATFISDVTLSKTVNVTSNVGYFRATNGGTRYNHTFAVSTINVSVLSNVSGYTEFYVFHGPESPVQKYVATGVAITVTKRTAFDINGGVGLPHNAAHGPDRYLGIGISRLF